MILVAIGANLPRRNNATPLETCRWGVEQLAALPGLRVDAVSQWYVTKAMPPSGQPPYVNAVARLSVEPGAACIEPAALLAALQAIEHAAGRVRGERNAARTLDLDIIAMGKGGQMVRTTPDPVLPHPRAHLRAFVLVPLLDVAAAWVHPMEGVAAEALLRRLPDQGVRLLRD
jgi:2-amino-4-hydroxy-6-hydroxymethyldihydropteridine diphosphokinase